MNRVKSDRLGPGTIKFGTTGSEAEFAIGCREVRVKNSVKEGDQLPVLSGDELDEGDEETYSLTGSILQSYDLKSFIVWSHVYAGQVLPWFFRPDNDKALGAKGKMKVRRVDFGGKPKERNESEFEFPGREGMYDLVDASGAEQTIISTWTAPTPITPATVDPDAWD